MLLALAGLLTTALSVTWGPAAGITNNRLENVTYSSNAHKVVYGQDGVGHLVWFDNGGGVGASAVYYKRYYPKTGWTSELKLNNNGAYPAIALDANGRDIHVVWSGYKKVGSTNFHILYQKCVPGKSSTGGWVGNPTDLCDNITGHSHAYPAAACGPNGQVVVTWMESWGTGAELMRTYCFREFMNGAWQPQQQIEEPIPSYRWNPSIATFGSGSVFVAYYGSTSLEPRDEFHVYVNERLGTTWQGWQNVTSSVGYPDSFITPHIEVDPATGNPHVVCHSYSISVSGSDTTRYYHIYHAFRSGGTWSIPEMISDGEAIADASPSMDFGADGTAHAIWKQAVPDRAVEYSFRDPTTGVWVVPTSVTSSDDLSFYSPSLTVGPGGVLYGVWTRYDASAKYAYQIWGSNTGSSSGGQAGPSAMANGVALDVSPNPVTRGMLVSYGLPAAGNVSLRLYDVSGVLVKTVDCGQQSSGNHTVSVSRQGLARGAYVLKLDTGVGSVTRKVVVE